MSFIITVLLIRGLLSIGIGYLAESMDHNGLLWGLLCFFLLGIWTVIPLILWHLVVGDD